MQIGQSSNQLDALDPGSRDRVRSATRRAMLWSLGMLFFVAIFASAQEPAQKAVGAPRVLLTVHMTSTDLRVLDIKFRGFYNKIEDKYIPLTDYNFAANLADELVEALADDRRAAWVGAKPDEQKVLEACFGPDWWKQKTVTPPAVEADRLLLIKAQYMAATQAIVHRLSLIVNIQMVDRTTGQVLWKKAMIEGMKLPGKLEELQADNQKALKEALNKLAEQIVPKIKKHLAQQKM